MGSINPYQTLVSNPDVALEFKSKVEELSRRLKANGFNYQNDYSVMNDRQRDIFTTGLFVIPEQADSIEEYVEFGHDNCECPDVMDDLNETCPMLMQGVATINEREQVQESNTIETTLDLLIEQCIEEIINEGRGIQHPSKIGQKIKNDKGEELEIAEYVFMRMGEPEQIKTQSDLAAAVQNLAKNRKVTSVLYNNQQGNEDKLPSTVKSVMIILAKGVKDKKMYAFIKYGGNAQKGSAKWEEQKFKQATGWGSTTSQAAKEILTVGPDLLGPDRAQKTALASIPGSLDASELAKIDSALAKSLPAYLKAAVGGASKLPILQFESEESRDRYLPSIYKYLSEVMGPIFLATGNKTFLGNDAVLDSALENLLVPRGVNSWTANDGVSWPTAKNERLKDSYVHYGDKQDIMVSSKAKAGANPSLAELYKQLEGMEEDEKQELVKLYGPDNPSGINLYTGNKEDPGVADIMADARYSWWDLPIRLLVEIKQDGNEILSGDEYNRIREVMAAQKSARWPRNLEMSDANLKAKLDGFKKYSGAKDSPDYSEARHIIAGMAKLAQAIINGAKDKSGEKLFTNFGKAMYNRLPLVQIYAKKGAYMPDGETGIKSGPLDIIYPARFDGEILVDGSKNYFASGNKGKMTIKIP